MSSHSCPLPVDKTDKVLMAHGSGGRLSQQLIDKLLLPVFGNPLLNQHHDGAAFPVEKGRLAISTDSYVVRPLFFPGGDIGRLAVFGTANDLAMCGAKPLYQTTSLIIEEGMEMEVLARIVTSMRGAADEAGVQIIAGDTKVVERGKGDGVFINTTGLGIIEYPSPIAPSSVRPDDVILLSGDIGRHGMAILSAREELGITSGLKSDCAQLWPMLDALLQEQVEIHCLRDLTRGGLAAALVEISKAADLGMCIEEKNIPVADAVRGTCELLGLDPMFVACEGRFIAFTPADKAEHILSILARFEGGCQACKIGMVQEKSGVRVQGMLEVERYLELPAGEQLPRIC